MEEVLFLDKNSVPTDLEIKEALSKSHSEWKKIQKHINETYGETQSEWKFYSKKSGWLKKTILKKRNIVFFKPCRDSFTLTFVLGDRAVDQIISSNISEQIVKKIKDAKKFAEGRSVSINVKNEKKVNDIIKLIDLKIQF